MENSPNLAARVEVGRLAIKDRRTGRVLKDGVPIFEGENPFRIPPPPLMVWRYLDWFKFEDLVVNRRLYFRRANCLDDHMEGSFSEGNRQFQTALWQRFHEAYSIRRNHEQERRINEQIRHRVFINCWHVNEHESATMWRLYTKSPESVVIRSRCRLLDSSTDGPVYQPVLVRYVSRDEPRPEHHSLAPFVFKDTSFSFEHEVRLLTVAGLNETIGNTDVSRTIPIRPEELILDVFTHPAAHKRFRRKVAAHCAQYLPHLKPRKSALERGAAARK
jgi:hypothetical protein